LPALRELCDRHGIWLVFDEVKIGLGRTGRMFAFEHSGVVADAVTLGKPLGGGLPLSAAVGRSGLLDVETHSLFTLGGSPGRGAGAVRGGGALATLAVSAADGRVENAAARGGQLLGGLEATGGRSRLIGDVRGSGLTLGVERVQARATREPAPVDAHRLVYR